MHNKLTGSDDDRFNIETRRIDDNEVINKILAGEKNLYALIIRKYIQRLFRIGLSIINNEAEVQDIMQASYIKAYENLGKFRFESRFSTWLTKILVNESLLHLKKMEQQASGNENKLPETAVSRADMETPLIKLLNSELKVMLEPSIRQLPEKYRTVFIMREIENMNVAETMECLNISEANVKVRLNRSKVMLRNMLKVYLGEEEILQLYNSTCDRMVDKVMQQILSARN